jgi:hypothetical protein
MRLTGRPAASRKIINFKGHAKTRHPCLGSPQAASLRPDPLKLMIFRRPVFTAQGGPSVAGGKHLLQAYSQFNGLLGTDPTPADIEDGAGGVGRFVG